MNEVHCSSFSEFTIFMVNHGSEVGIATGYGLDDGGAEVLVG
jgi:hypothetical protein